MIDEMLYESALLEFSNLALTALFLAIVLSSCWLVSFLFRRFAVTYHRFPQFTAKDIL